MNILIKAIQLNSVFWNLHSYTTCDPSFWTLLGVKKSTFTFLRLPNKNNLFTVWHFLLNRNGRNSETKKTKRWHFSKHTLHDNQQLRLAELFPARCELRFLPAISRQSDRGGRSFDDLADSAQGAISSSSHTSSKSSFAVWCLACQWITGFCWDSTEDE